MQTQIISATKARNDFFNILDWVSMGNKVLVKKDGGDAITMSSSKIGSNLAGLQKAMVACHGILKDFDLSQSPLRGAKAKKWMKRIGNYKF